jgi:hypothetical protein
MKVQPALFSTPPVSNRPITQNSPARLAFEAMLSAGAARQTIPAQKEVAPQTGPVEPTDTPLVRPGRVLDIRV